MTANFEDDSAAWRRCELAWAGWLESKQHVVLHTGEATGNSPGTRAPLVSVDGRRRRAPDLLSTNGGVNAYWEIKFRSRSDFDQLTGERVHWTSLEAFDDYAAIAAASGCKVWVVLYEGPTSTLPGRWLRADVDDLTLQGRQGTRFGRGGSPLAAWIWPASAMEVIDGPPVDLSDVTTDLLPPEGELESVGASILESIERRLRDQLPGSGASLDVDKGGSEPGSELLKADPILALDVLCRSLGIPTLPRYSVLRVGLDGLDINEVLGLLHYGIRVFLITEEGAHASFDEEELQAFRDSRLLEWAIIGEGIDYENQIWIVDGVFPEPISERLRNAIDKADEIGGINVGQYRIVHAPINADLLVTAGAGTGKTETMSERTVFLLATSGGTAAARGDAGSRPFDLRADDFVFVTFTKEAAREMRHRIGHTIMLRQRLCRRCVLPALAWLMQLGSAEIATIHAYAKHVLQAAGGGQGLGPEMTVSRQTLDIRRMLHERLSPYLAEMIASYSRRVPPAHLWEDHLERIWTALENNGIEMIPAFDQTHLGAVVDWGQAEGEGLEERVAKTTRLVLEEASSQYRALCLSNQSVRSSDLVPLALAALKDHAESGIRRPRYLFVDEFQDTDALQMQLFLEVRTRLDANLFVVGDAKQGIYRFRGAEGNAFRQLGTLVDRYGLQKFDEYSLSRNFRSGERLLNSLHPYFERWADSGCLVYSPSDRLRAASWHPDGSLPIEFSKASRRDYASQAAGDVALWRAQQPEATIAILCRQNGQALKVKAEIESHGGNCELLVGGSFFQTPAVRELDAFLRAVAEPTNDAALLQICETRWAAGLLGRQAPRGVNDPAWRSPVSPIRGWHDRLGSLNFSGSYERSDLEPLRSRLAALADLLTRMPLMTWLVECSRALTPECTHLASDVDSNERTRYARCFDHLLTLMDTHFESRPVSMQRLRTWLELQIATNSNEDEPVELAELRGRTVALTVHKAKGLEFDLVLVPNSWTPFEGSRIAGTRAAVLRRSGEMPRLVWEWKDASFQNAAFSNVAPDEETLWQLDKEETAREEARLLYVALTRAREQVRVYVPYQGRPQANPSSWADLLNYGR